MSDVQIDVSGLIASGWRYTDWPRMEPALWDEMVAAIGPENHHLLSLAEYHAGDKSSHVDAKRGQMIISPEGVRLLSEWGVLREHASLSTAGARHGERI